MFQKTTILLALLSCLSMMACARSPGGVSASNVPVAQDGYRTLGKVAVSDCKVNLLMVLPISGSNYLWNAVEEAMREIPGTDALVNITVDRVTKVFILWSQRCTEVRDTAVRFK
jgi:hypothetical protein